MVHAVVSGHTCIYAKNAAVCSSAVFVLFRMNSGPCLKMMDLIATWATRARASLRPSGASTRITAPSPTGATAAAAAMASSTGGTPTAWHLRSHWHPSSTRAASPATIPALPCLSSTSRLTAAADVSLPRLAIRSCPRRGPPRRESTH